MAPVKLKREINVIQGMGIVVGIVVGSGIFVSPVGVLKYTQSTGLSFVMWTITGLFSTLGAITYAELGVTIPRSGGEYVYIIESFGPLLAFLAFWINFAVICGAAGAANSLLFAEYILRPFYGTCCIPGVPAQITAVLCILTLCFVNCYRVSWSTKLSVIFTASKVAALLLIVMFGGYYLSQGSISSFREPFEDSATSPGALAMAFYQGFWAFSGWNCINFLTGEMKNPSRTLPIVILLSLPLITVIYLLANIAYLAVLSPFEVLASGGGSAAVAVTFAERCMGVMSWAMPIFVGASVFGSANGDVLAMSRIAFSASEEGHMPAVLSMVSITNLTPIPSVIAAALIIIGYQRHPNVFYLIELTGFAFSVISSMAVASLIHIRRVHPEMNRSGLKLPLFLPILYLIGNIFIGALTVYQSPTESALSLALMATGIPVYLIGVTWKKKPRSFRSAIYNLTVRIQKLLNVVPEEKAPKRHPLMDQESDSGVEGKWLIASTP
ncbi:unnamed protein product [Calicophoron daubneyi]|uniref:Uncharacterized protein n=1 Tax=Calicophoron daubneyi TaxID=300641 RepID=A0AAV2THW0_CALDB